ncbi:MAG: sigma-70 family RNA polymerase sigma factor [Acidobacteria bacterium]|nr:sigma-70 family RNA polymerase sigma factor [Acidobacteriota bacterium]
MDADASDDHLIARTLAGETEAFSILVRRWERPIYSLTLRMLGRDEDARDACQEAFLAAFRNLNKFRGDAKFSSWMYRIALNACHTRLRSSNGPGSINYSLDQEDENGRRMEVADTSTESLPEQVHRVERSQHVRRALQALPPEMRQVIVMKEYEEMTFAEIAEVLGIPVSTVKSRLYTGLQQMRLRLNSLHGAI